MREGAQKLMPQEALLPNFKKKNTNEQIPSKTGFKQTHEHPGARTHKHEFIGDRKTKIIIKKKIYVNLGARTCDLTLPLN